MSRQVQVSFDAGDPAALARFWAVALDYVEQPPPPGFDTWHAFLESEGVPPEERDRAAALVDPDGVGPRLFFQRVPEPKSAKNRMHLDVNVGGHGADPSVVDAHVRRLVEAGGTMVEDRHDRFSRWVVMTDPEGNEFCVQ